MGSKFCGFSSRSVFSSGSHALFTGSTSTIFNNVFFKTGSHGTIHIFKNYFATIFSVFDNKQYPNRSLVYYFSNAVYFLFNINFKSKVTDTNNSINILQTVDVACFTSTSN